VDYLGMILAAEEAAARDGIAYRELADPGHNDANDEEDAS
jgi:hypothetical protein